MHLKHKHLRHGKISSEHGSFKIGADGSVHVPDHLGETFLSAYGDTFAKVAAKPIFKASVPKAVPVVEREPEIPMAPPEPEPEPEPAPEPEPEPEIVEEEPEEAEDEEELEPAPPPKAPVDLSDFAEKVKRITHKKKGRKKKVAK